MIGLGLSASAQANFHTLLASSHRIQVTAQILNLGHTRLSDVSTMFLDGQVTLDVDAAITRAATISFFDPYHRMALDAASPADGALFMDRMIALYYTVMAPDFSSAVTVPVFTGPITKIDRDWAVVQVECQGKESLSLNTNWTPKTYPKGANKVGVIRDILATLTGETKFSLPVGTGNVIGSAIALSNDSKPWEVAKWLASTMACQLFYDGRGVCVMRPWPRNVAWNFSDGDGGTVMSKPQVGYDDGDLVNSVIVKGATTKGTVKTPFVYKKFAPSTHPLSPWVLGRNGVPRYFTKTIDDPNITSLTEAAGVATAELTKGLMQPVQVAFDAYPIPHLEESDLYRIQTSEFTTISSIQKVTLPLVTSGKMTVGYLKNTVPTRKSRQPVVTFGTIQRKRP